MEHLHHVLVPLKKVIRRENLKWTELSKFPLLKILNFFSRLSNKLSSKPNNSIIITNKRPRIISTLVIPLVCFMDKILAIRSRENKLVKLNSRRPIILLRSKYFGFHSGTLYIQSSVDDMFGPTKPDELTKKS